MEKLTKKENQRIFKVTFRLTEREKKHFIERANKAYMTPSEYLRKSIKDSNVTTRLSPEEIEIYKGFLRIGHNVNSILKLAHIAKITLLEQQCKDVLNEIHSHIKRLSHDW